jgi:hypothetical protein
MKAWLIVLCIAVIQGTNVFCQQKEVSRTGETYWQDGSVLLTDGTELKGKLQYNGRLGILRYEDNDGERTLNPKNVTAFEFFDVTVDKQRVFYSLEYQESAQTMKRLWFFEILQDFKTFAVISRIDPFDAIVETKSGPFSNAMKGNGSSDTKNPIDDYWSPEVVMESETIFFLDGSGRIDPYSRVIRKTIHDMMGPRNKTSNKILDKKVVLKFFTEDELENMEKYADDNDLNTKTKSDFVKMLAFAKTLKKN